MQTEQLLCWDGMTDPEHSTTSSSNEEVKVALLFVVKKNYDILKPRFI